MSAAAVRPETARFGPATPERGYLRWELDGRRCTATAAAAPEASTAGSVGHSGRRESHANHSVRRSSNTRAARHRVASLKATVSACC